MAVLQVRTDDGDGSRIVFGVTGGLDSSGARQLRYHVEAALVLHKPRELHIDLGGVPADSAGESLASALLAAAKAAVRRFCRLVICRPVPSLRALIADRQLPVCAGHEPSHHDADAATYPLDGEAARPREAATGVPRRAGRSRVVGSRGRRPVTGSRPATRRG